MSGPIVRTGASPEFSKNWDNIFGKKDAAGKAAEKAPPTDAAKADDKSGAAKKKGKPA